MESPLADVSGARLTIVTDAWHPQVNGVVRSIETTNRELEKLGVTVSLITPQRFRSVPMPTYPEIRLSLTTPRKLGRMIAAERPDYLHIATEGPLGILARNWALKHGMAFSTSYHTRFPEYVAERLPVPIGWLYGFIRWFHNRGGACMVATESLRRELSEKGLRNLQIWSRGIDTALFHPRPREETPFGLARPIFMTVGRVAVEKNLPAFLDLDLPGSKVVVGDGPAREELAARYPGVTFTGVKFGEDLARAYAQADVFVFPSRTDTFGNTILEALASGVPVAAYPVTGPVDIIPQGSGAGALDEDLRAACLAALPQSREAARALAETFSWASATQQFMANVVAAKARKKRRQRLAEARGRQFS
ncbi:glycosyltransferase family 4 protein [Rhizobium halophytocola]|nr:glycosyltransferase family 1 protein [Rhizobium halophytocola]